MQATGVTSKATRLKSGLELCYHEAGEGEPIVFLHGGGPGASGLSNYQQNYSYFVEHGYRVLMPDLIGWGQSSKPSGVKYDDELLAGSLAQWLESLDIEKCVIVGNSMGGAIALSLAIDHVDLVGKLVLLAPASVAPPEVYADMPGIQALIKTVSGEGEISLDAMISLFECMYHDPSEIDKAIIAERTSVANTQPKDLFANLQLTNHAEQLHKISCPTLILWGASDKFCPLRTGLDIVRKMPKSRLVAFSQCGHWVQIEQTERFNRLTLDFINND